MADPRRMELDELANRPGTYFHPQTEMLLIVDDGAALDAEIFQTRSPSTSTSEMCCCRPSR
jgi:hypothetical protein